MGTKGNALSCDMRKGKMNVESHEAPVIVYEVTRFILRILDSLLQVLA